MKIIVASTESSNQIQIDVLENPGLVRWFKNCQSLQLTSPIIGSINYNSLNKVGIPLENYQLLYTQLLTSINKLKMLLEEKQITSVKFPEIPLEFNYDQIWCNDIHNIFVSLNFFLKDNYHQYWQKSTDWDSVVFETIKEINELIHKLEKWAGITENREYLKNHYSHTHLQTRFDTSVHGLKLWFEFTEEEQQLYHSTYIGDKFYDVVFSNEILGKTFFRSFIDNERSNSPAISGIDKTWGNLDIKLDNQRTKIFKDTKFKNWVETLNVDTGTAPLEFPVGSINSNSNLDYFVKRKTTEVVFHFVD